jgi:hypothetical protein
MYGNLGSTVAHRLTGEAIVAMAPVVGIQARARRVAEAAALSATVRPAARPEAAVGRHLQATAMRRCVVSGPPRAAPSSGVCR